MVRRGLEGNRQQGSCRRSEEHTSELQSLMRISYAVFCLKKKKKYKKNIVIEKAQTPMTYFHPNTHHALADQCKYNQSATILCLPNTLNTLYEWTLHTPA